VSTSQFSENYSRVWWQLYCETKLEQRAGTWVFRNSDVISSQPSTVIFAGTEGKVYRLSLLIDNISLIKWHLMWRSSTESWGKECDLKPGKNRLSIMQSGMLWSAGSSRLKKKIYYKNNVPNNVCLFSFQNCSLRDPWYHLWYSSTIRNSKTIIQHSGDVPQYFLPIFLLAFINYTPISSRNLN
jgi:hypothetical protein